MPFENCREIGGNRTEDERANARFQNFGPRFWPICGMKYSVTSASGDPGKGVKREEDKEIR